MVAPQGVSIWLTPSHRQEETMFSDIEALVCSVLICHVAPTSKFYVNIKLIREDDI